MVRERVRAIVTHEARKLVLPLAILTVISTVGTAAAPTLAADQPLVLVALSPRLSFLTLAAGKVGLVPFFVVGMIRLCLADPFHFALGRRHGAGAVERLPGRVGRVAMKVRRIASRSIPLLASCARTARTSPSRARARAAGCRWRSPTSSGQRRTSSSCTPAEALSSDRVHPFPGRRGIQNL